MRRSLDRGEPVGVELLQGCPSAGSLRPQSWTPGNHDDDDSGVGDVADVTLHM